MKTSVLVLSLSLVSLSALAGGVVDSFRPSVLIDCVENQQLLRQNDSFFASLDPKSAVVQQLISDGTLNRGYAHNAGFGTKNLVVVIGNSILNEKEPTQLIANFKTANGKILNNYDYDVAAQTPLANGQRVRFNIALTKIDAGSALLAFQKVADPLHRCLRTEKQNFGQGPIDVCVEHEISTPGFVVSEVTTELSFAACKIIK